MGDEDNLPIRFDKEGPVGIGLAILSFVTAFIIAAFGFGGVINMGTVAICLGVAGVFGISGIITIAIWLKPWLRKTYRTGIGLVASILLVFGLQWLYGWIKVNGHRLDQQTARSAAHKEQPPPIIPSKTPATDSTTGTIVTSMTNASHKKPKRHAHEMSNTAKLVDRHQTSSGANSPNTAVNGDGNQVMNGSTDGVQQHSTGPNSPNTFNRFYGQIDTSDLQKRLKNMALIVMDEANAVNAELEKLLPESSRQDRKAIIHKHSIIFRQEYEEDIFALRNECSDLHVKNYKLNEVLARDEPFPKFPEFPPNDLSSFDMRDIAEGLAGLALALRSSSR